jgi:putative DNA primase/helicase
MSSPTPTDMRGLFLESGAEAVREKCLSAKECRPEQEPPPAQPPDPDSIEARATARSLCSFEGSDAGNAERLHEVHGENLRHVTESGQWLVWDGCRWTPDSNGEVTRRFIEVMRATVRQAADIDSSDVAKAVTKFALSCCNRARIDAGIHIAKAIQGVSISVNDLDANPWLVGTPDGVIDLRQGKPITPRREHLITKSVGASFDPLAKCPTWERFIATVTGGDAELADFLQAAVGYTLTGHVTEQCLFFLHGTGANGKGVFSETVKRLICDYGQTAPESLFTKDRHPGAPSNDIARLTGCRLAIAAELDEGAAFAEARIKSLTGGDSITARLLFREYFDFQPTHKFWISGNHKPTVKGTDLGIWRRLRLVPFTVTIPEGDKDPYLAAKLAVELPGILNWAIAGCLRWQRDGLRVPQCVKAATEAYRQAEDIIGQFLDDSTEKRHDARIARTELYRAYQAWAEGEGINRPVTARRFNRQVEERGFHGVKSHGILFWAGIAAKVDDSEVSVDF